MTRKVAIKNNTRQSGGEESGGRKSCKKINYVRENGSKDNGD